ncbi:MAG: hypothetical protein SGI97_02160 [candidate division Zixibacteria bacterium]|nr:hypothetical protein [candidate division Zixibacteria bacterium]
MTTANADSYCHFRYGNDSSLTYRSDTFPCFSQDSLFTLSYHIVNFSPGTDVFYRLMLESNGGLIEGAIQSTRLIEPKPPVVTTGTVSQLGPVNFPRTPGITFNGSIVANDLPTTYYFEYGTDMSYGQTTDTFSTGPQLEAYYSEDFSKSGGGFKMIPSSKVDHIATGGITDGYITATTYSEFHDPNHISGIGYINLVTMAYTSADYRGLDYLGLGGGEPDFRDAEIEFALRSQNFHENGSTLNFWTQSERGTAFADVPWVRTNWAFTEIDLFDTSSKSRSWQNISFVLENDASKWTYAGNNLTDGNPWRYQYVSLDSSLAKLNVDFIFALTSVDKNSPPNGVIDLDDITIRYRNHSLLFSGNGGRLIGWPLRSLEDPFSLTDGYRFGEGKMWHGEDTTDHHQTFLYSFDSTVTIKRIQIHQNPLWPSNEVECSVSEDNVNFTIVDTLNIPFDEYQSDNLAYVTSRLPVPVQARYFKLIILSGQREGPRGLGEIDLFGDGGVVNSGIATNNVNTDAIDLTSGESYHYRLVAWNSQGIVFGKNRTFMVPYNLPPVALTANPTVVNQTKVIVSGTAQFFGQQGTSYFEYGLDTFSLQSTPVKLHTNDPNQIASIRTDTLAFLNPQSTYVYRMVTVNPEGTMRGNFQSLTTPVNNAPFVEFKPDILLEADSIYQFTFQVIDPDVDLYQDSISWQLISAPSWIHFDSLARTISGTPTLLDNCDSIVTIRVFDNRGASTDNQFTLRIAGAYPPVPLSPADDAIATLTLPTTPLSFAWKRTLPSANDSLNYFIHLFGPKLDTVMASTGDTTIQLDIMSHLLPGQSYHWTVNSLAESVCNPQTDTFAIFTSSQVEYALRPAVNEMSFGQTAIGDSGKADIWVHNVSAQAIHITQLRMSGAAFHVTNPQSMKIEPHDSLLITIQFIPNSFGACQDSLSVFSTGGSSVVALSGLSPLPTISADNYAVSYGRVMLGDTAFATVGLDNNSLNKLTVQSIKLASGVFMIDSLLYPLYVTNERTLTLIVRFAPDSAGFLSDTLVITGDASAPLKISVEGIGDVSRDITGGGLITESTTLPTSYSLMQNNPNPFNPETQISYALPRTSRVEITIYNILGRVEDVLVDRLQDAGVYEVIWRASGASGIYLYRFEAIPIDNSSESFIQTKKMVLVK